MADVRARRGPRIDRRMLAAKAEELGRTIRKLTDVRDSPRHAADCRAPSHMLCPAFRSILQAARAIGAGREKSFPTVWR